MIDYDETDGIEDEDEFDEYWDYEDYYGETDGYPDYPYEPPSRRQLLVWELQTALYRLRHPLLTIRGWWNRNIVRCEQCGKRNRNCDCIPF